MQAKLYDNLLQDDVALGKKIVAKMAFRNSKKGKSNKTGKIRTAGQVDQPDNVDSSTNNTTEVGPTNAIMDEITPPRPRPSPFPERKKGKKKSPNTDQSNFEKTKYN